MTQKIEMKDKEKVLQWPKRLRQVELYLKSTMMIQNTETNYLLYLKKMTMTQIIETCQT